MDSQFASRSEHSNQIDIHTVLCVLDFYPHHALSRHLGRTIWYVERVFRRGRHRLECVGDRPPAAYCILCFEHQVDCRFAPIQDPVLAQRGKGEYRQRFMRGTLSLLRRC